MPKEILLLGVALLFGAWFVLDPRSLKDKIGFLFLLFFLYVGYQWLSGRPLSEIIKPITQFFSVKLPQSPEEE